MVDVGTLRNQPPVYSGRSRAKTSHDLARVVSPWPQFSLEHLAHRDDLQHRIASSRMSLPFSSSNAYRRSTFAHGRDRNFLGLTLYAHQYGSDVGALRKRALQIAAVALSYAIRWKGSSRGLHRRHLRHRLSCGGHEI